MVLYLDLVQSEQYSQCNHRKAFDYNGLVILICTLNSTVESLDLIKLDLWFSAKQQNTCISRINALQSELEELSLICCARDNSQIIACNYHHKLTKDIGT